MYAQRDLALRIGVGAPDGPKSPSLKIWARPDRGDVYAAVREIAAGVEVSLHASGECNAGLADRFAAAEPEALALLGSTRHQSQWRRPSPVGKGFVTPVMFAFPASEFRKWREQPVGGGIQWLPQPSEGRSTVVSCVFGNAAAPEPNWQERGVECLGSQELANGDKVWVVWREAPTSLIEQQVLALARTKLALENPVWTCPGFSDTGD